MEKKLTKMQMVLGYIRNIFIPTKSKCVLGLYQKTITISIYVILALSMFAIMLESIEIKSHWFLFFENCMIGVVCSTIVVVITSILQFKTEQPKYIDAHNGALLDFVIQVSMRIEKQDNPNGLPNKDNLEDVFREYIDTVCNLVWYNPQREKEFNNVLKGVLSFASIVYNTDNIDYEKSSKNLISLLDSAVQFTKHYDNYEFNIFEVLQKKKSERADMKDSLDAKTEP